MTEALLPPEDAREVLRYWLAVLRHEATSSVGLQEAPVESRGERFLPDLLQPSVGRPYFELPSAGDEGSGLMDFLVQRRHHLVIDRLQARHAPFCEHALRDAYRREFLASRGQRAPERPSMLVVGFPVVRFEQRGRPHLAPLLQLPVAVDWLDEDGRAWVPPNYRSRRSGKAGPAPSSLALHAFDAELLGQPYLVNTNLLQRVTGIDVEVIEQLASALDQADEMTCESLIAGLTTFLRDGTFETDAFFDDHPASLIDDLCHALASAFRGRGQARITSFAMVGDAAWGIPTAGLQREASEIARKPELWSPALIAYLAGERPEGEPRALRGLLAPRGLTANQRAAAEQALGSTFTTVEGPPGTGKTDLVLNLVAHTLVENVARGVYGPEESAPVNCVLVSTNNQAVDNVVAPLITGDSPPLALRLGNRETMALQTASTLERVQHAIEGADAPRARAELRAAQERFEAHAGASDDASSAEIFKAARAVRDAWMRAHAAELVPLLRRLRAAAGGRGWWSQQVEDPDVLSRLAALFPAWGCTLLSIANALPLERGVIDLLVVDEAGQCNVSYPVAALSRARRALVLGDTHQLEPVTTLTEREERAVLADLSVPEAHPVWPVVRLSRSAHTSAQRLAEWRSGDVIRLRDHFRCQPAIVELSNKLCGYDLAVRTEAPTSAAADALPDTVCLIDVDGHQEAWYGSQRNHDEAVAVAHLVRDLIDQGVLPEDIGVLTPYRAQTSLLRRTLREAGVRVDDWEHSVRLSAEQRHRGGGPLLGTIHRLQGGERDVVILSTVATEPGSIAWLNQRPNLMNVAVSRARDRLVIIGRQESLAHGPHTQVLIPT